MPSIATTTFDKATVNAVLRFMASDEFAGACTEHATGHELSLAVKEKFIFVHEDDCDQATLFAILMHMQGDEFSLACEMSMDNDDLAAVIAAEFLSQD